MLTKIKSIPSRFKKMSKFEKVFMVLLFLWLFYNYSPTNVVVETFEPELTDDGRIAITYSLDTFYIKEEGWEDTPDDDGVHSFKLDKTAMDFLLYQEENQVIMIVKGWFIRFWDDIPNKNIERIIIRGKDREGKNDINIVDFISNG